MCWELLCWLVAVKQPREQSYNSHRNEANGQRQQHFGTHVHGQSASRIRREMQAVQRRQRRQREATQPVAALISAPTVRSAAVLP